MLRVQLETPEQVDAKILAKLRRVAKELNAEINTERNTAAPGSYSLTIAHLPDPT